ncbi:NAD(P)-dependent oxidoreductase [Streptomyces sp. NBC_01716]|uniref:NAD(P)-dependent oxidoreductase n=1 Tax=Streptomyces sp. NBC_01716 TaxID=2975917 RepID=UPI002E2FD080|nr:NAD(P)-dependent oxidoreductase [Streptomyces sp. NBC_01716]
MTGPEPAAVIGFLGLGGMGAPMAGRLAAAGHQVRGYDTAPGTRARLAAGKHGVEVVDSAEQAVRGADTVVLMLPDSTAVDRALLGDGLISRLEPGTLVIDMGSSEPARTRELAASAAGHGVSLMDAPVSGGVLGARQGTLTIMAGGTEEQLAQAGPLLGVLGSKVTHVGPAGAGHALKSLNNLMSATHLLITSEALLTGAAFGLDPATMLEAVNGSSGRSGSTEVKWPRFVLGRGFDSGFALRLMLKDMRTATGLAAATGTPSVLGEAAVALWESAAGRLPLDADHTEIVRWLEESRERAEQEEHDNAEADELRRPADASTEGGPS